MRAHHASVVDQHIGTAEAGQCLVEQRLGASLGRRIGAHGQQTFGLSQFLRCALQHVGAAAVQHHAAAFVQKRFGQCQAHALAGAGDDNHTVLQRSFGFGAAHLAEQSVDRVVVAREVA